MTRLLDLEQHPCRSLCWWQRVEDVVVADQPLFACDGCGSQWVPSEGWTPLQHDGHVDPDVLAAVAAHRTR